ncbi:MAG: DUF512 domain-containing protein [Candidatus Eisenbacteria bacterium]|nr:DUF512 domain-containing protein [Candidatus Eisenbacteria bacterium]
MKVAAVAAGSLAERAGVRAGDRIVRIGDRPVRDSLDFAFLSAESELALELRHADGSRERVFVERPGGAPLGITPEPDPVRRCGNDCVFCFIGQNPKGLRPSLYVRDEDYRLSLLYGNYVTLTPLRGWEVDRILAQRLSPLYVSVHATDARVRRRLLRCRGSGAILPLLRTLAGGNITLHTQIVLVPGWNDGAVLERTLRDLTSLGPAVRSVAIVPVGLTRHRRGLPTLRRMRAGEARRLIERVADWQAHCLRRYGSRRVFLADEIYLLAGERLPEAPAYEAFAQVENGVGLVRQFDQRLRRLRRLLPGERRRFQRAARGRGRRRRVLAVTGRLFAPLLERRLARALQRTGEAERWRVEVRAVENRLFGPRVTVAGLLSGADILRAVGDPRRPDRVLLPPDVLSEEGITLDDQTPEQMARALGAVLQVDIGSRARLHRGA